MLSEQVDQRLQTLHPDIHAHLGAIIDLAPSATDPLLLNLCSSYIDAALMQRDWVAPKDGLSDRERAFIAFTEQFTSSVSTLDDEQVARLQKYASADEIYGFVNALYVADMVRRLDLVAGRILS